MPNLCRGRIVRVEVLDPQNRNPKCRPAVIVTPTEEISADGDVLLVAITGNVAAASAEVQVALPWHAQGQVGTRLNKPSVAVCSWIFTSPVSKIQSYGGMIPDRQMLQILDKINALAPPPPPRRPPIEHFHIVRDRSRRRIRSRRAYFRLPAHCLTWPLVGSCVVGL